MKWRNISEGRYYDPGESTVIYFDSRSGDTHLLSAFAAHVLRELEASPLTTDELAERVSQAVEPGEAADLDAALSAVLEELVGLDILKQD